MRPLGPFLGGDARCRQGLGERGPRSPRTASACYCSAVLGPPRSMFCVF